MTHVSLKTARQQRNHLPHNDNRSFLKRLWLRAVRWLKRLAVTLKRQRRNRRAPRKHRLDQLSDRELKDIGLTRDSLGIEHQRHHQASSYGESEYLHKGLRDLQSDLIRRLPRDYY